MKRSALTAVALIAFLSIVSATTAEDHNTHHATPLHCKAPAFRLFSEKVWSPKHWERKSPSQVIIDAQHRRLQCAPKALRPVLKELWRAAKKAFYKHRAAQLFRVRITPFYCAGTWWATECTIPEHESGYGSGGGNLYGMLDAWALHGCTVFAGSAWDATKREQDICAHRHWVDYGRGGWPSY